MGGAIEMTPGGDYDIVAYSPEAEPDDEDPGQWLTIEATDMGLAVYAARVMTGFAVFRNGQLLFQRPESSLRTHPSLARCAGQLTS